MPRDTSTYTLTIEIFIYKQIYCYPHVADTQDETLGVKYIHSLDTVQPD